jgi:hypothetical protein
MSRAEKMRLVGLKIRESLREKLKTITVAGVIVLVTAILQCYYGRESNQLTRRQTQLAEEQALAQKNQPPVSSAAPVSSPGPAPTAPTASNPTLPQPPPSPPIHHQVRRTRIATGGTSTGQGDSTGPGSVIGPSSLPKTGPATSLGPETGPGTSVGAGSSTATSADSLPKPGPNLRLNIDVRHFLPE